MRRRLVFAIFVTSFCLVLPESAALANTVSCATSVNPFVAFSRSRTDKLPAGTKRLKRLVIPEDVYLMTASYRLSSDMQFPIEMGRADLLDKHGNVIDTETHTGTLRRISTLSGAVLEMLARNAHRMNAITTARITHTHPQEFIPVIDAAGFSKGDVRADQHLRSELDRLGFKSIRFESWILFLEKDQFMYPSSITDRDIQARGYEVRLLEGP